MKGKKIVSTLLALLLLASLPVSALAAEWDIGNGDITVNAGSGGQTVTQGGGAAIEDSAPVITGTSTDNTLTINAEKDQTASVTLSGANIDVSGKGKAAVTTTGDGNVSIELDGESTLKGGYKHAGLEKNNIGSLTIGDTDKDGKLTAKGGQYGAGIGGGYNGNGSDITITDGEVNATGGKYGAGIGGGEYGIGKDIIITGGEVNATGGRFSAGIGGGSRGTGSDIKITGGEVNASGGVNGAGIGGGLRSKGNDITVSGKTARSILISCGARLAPFDIPQLREIMSYDEMELDRLGDRKTATFFVISDTDTTYNFVVALAFSQMFNLLCERADNVHGGRLPHHVRVLWDEAANTGQVPQLEKIVAVIRSREISLTMFLQAQSQLKALYKDHAETIMGNMDSVVFLGGREHTTIKELSEALGKETISMNTESRTRGHSESYGQNTQRLGKELMTMDELTTMDGNRCILQLRGLRPFYSPKYDLKKHPNYKYTAEADKERNAFDLSKLVTRHMTKLDENEQYTVYEATEADLPAIDEDEDILNYDDVDDPDAFA